MFDDTQADELLTGLVEQYSPSTQERPAVTYLVEQMNALGFRAYIDGAGNAVGEMGHGGRPILLLGHIDTVPGEIEVRRAAPDNSLLYGRGTVDAKGPLATFVSAAARVGAQPDKQFIVVGAVEEEAATSKGARFLLDRLSPEAVVIGEPSGWNAITVGYKGRLLLDYTDTQPIGHTAGPQTSICEPAVDFWHHVASYGASYNADRPRMFDQLLPSLRSINSQSDGFVESVAMTIGFRLPPGIDIDRLQDTLIEIAPDAQIHFRGRETAFRGSRSTPLARAFVKAIHSEEPGTTQQRTPFKVKSGTSDMNVVGPVWNCPILAYGPGDATLDHTPNEHIDLNEYHKAICVLASVLITL